MAIVIKRVSDGAIFPYTPETSKKPGFVVVNDPDIAPYQGKGKSRVALRKRAGEEARRNSIVEEFAGYTDDALAAYCSTAHHLDIPADMPRAQILTLISEYRLTKSNPADGEAAPEPAPVADPDPEPAASQPEADTDPLAGKTKQDLIDLASEEYGFQMPATMNLNQMRAQIRKLQAEKRGA